MRVRWSQHAPSQLLEAVAHLEQPRAGGRRLHGSIREIVDVLHADARAFPRFPGIGEGRCEGRSPAAAAWWMGRALRLRFMQL